MCDLLQMCTVACFLGDTLDLFVLAYSVIKQRSSMSLEGEKPVIICCFK